MKSMPTITPLKDEDKKKIINELRECDKIDIHRDLLRQRQLRITIMSFLLAALVLTVIYGTLENPFQFTLSAIGNQFTYRILFIVWAIVTGFVIQFTIIALFRLEQYPKEQKAYKYVILATINLILTALVPALGEQYPIWHIIHHITAGFHALFILLALFPFTNWISKENPRLRFNLRIWQAIIWGVSPVLMLFMGKSGIFELWFYGSVLVYLLYLSLTLFEEVIVKQSVELLRDEANLNVGIERMFIRLEDKKNK